jgi:hypothetical protein
VATSRHSVICTPTSFGSDSAPQPPLWSSLPAPRWLPARLQAAADRVVAFKRTVDRCHGRIQELKSYTDSLFQGIFAHRFRWVGGCVGGWVCAWVGGCVRGWVGGGWGYL